MAIYSYHTYSHKQIMQIVHNYQNSD